MPKFVTFEWGFSESNSAILLFQDNWTWKQESVSHLALIYCLLFHNFISSWTGCFFSTPINICLTGQFRKIIVFHHCRGWTLICGPLLQLAVCMIAFLILFGCCSQMPCRWDSHCGLVLLPCGLSDTSEVRLWLQHEGKCCRRYWLSFSAFLLSIKGVSVKGA